jgi:glycosyltransferase involved in cell wall biosynthesis
VAAASQAWVLVPPGDARSLAQAILRLAEDGEARKAMGTRARRYSEIHLSRDRILSGLEELFSQLRAEAEPPGDNLNCKAPCH